MRDWLVLFCVGILAVFAFHERSFWLPQKAALPAATPPVESPPVVQKVNPVPPVSPAQKADPVRRTDPETVLSPPPAEVQLAPTSPEKMELAGLVTQSQRLALARYPALSEATSELNIRFNYRYKRMLAEYSPRLQDPSWPLQLADECARAAGIRPVGMASTPSPPVPPVAASHAPPPPREPLAAASPPASPASGSPPAPAAAQTLAFHPTAERPPAAPPSPAAAAPAAHALPFVTMDAVNQSSGNNYTYNWGSYYGWYDISYRQSVGIAINVRNMSRVPESLNLRWIFFARNPHNNERFIFAAAGKELALAPGESSSVAAASPLLQSREVNYGWIGERYMYGSKYEGWLVQLLERGGHRVVKQSGSTSYLEDLAKRDDFSAIVEAYRAKLPGQGGTAGF